MEIDDKYRKEFFSKNITIMNDKKDNEGQYLVKKLKTIGFSNVDIVQCTQDFRSQLPIIYHSGDVIRGERINLFLKYSQQYANSI